MKKIIFILILFLPFLNTYASNDCENLGTTSAKTELEKSNYVFIGTITDIGINNKYQKFLIFDIIMSLKGDDFYDKFYIQDKDKNPIIFEKGKEYLVYGSKKNGKQYINTCSRTKLTKDAKNEFKELNDIIIKRIGIDFEIKKSDDDDNDKSSILKNKNGGKDISNKKNNYNKKSELHSTNKDTSKDFFNLPLKALSIIMLLLIIIYILIVVLISKKNNSKKQENS